jgi:hypothetical protein
MSRTFGNNISKRKTGVAVSIQTDARDIRCNCSRDRCSPGKGRGELPHCAVSWNCVGTYSVPVKAVSHLSHGLPSSASTHLTLPRPLQSICPARSYIFTRFVYFFAGGLVVALMMEAEGTCETLLNFCKTTRRSCQPRTKEFR